MFLDLVEKTRCSVERRVQQSFNVILSSQASIGGSKSGEDDGHLEHVISLLGFGRFQEQSLCILICMQLVDGMEMTLSMALAQTQATARRTTSQE